MKKVLITGASGMVGKIILRECLRREDIKTVSSIVRRASGLNHPKLVEIIHGDFLDYSKIEAAFRDIDAAFFCIGVYTGQVPDAEFKKITVDFAKVFADVLKTQSPQVKLSFLSGMGADPEEKSRTSFARYKGMAENYLITKNFDGLYIFRPGYIYPVEKRNEPNLSYRIFRKIYPLMKKIYSKGMITSEVLAQAMLKAALHTTHKKILENEDIKEV